MDSQQEVPTHVFGLKPAALSVPLKIDVRLVSSYRKLEFCLIDQKLASTATTGNINVNEKRKLWGFMLSKPHAELRVKPKENPFIPRFEACWKKKTHLHPLMALPQIWKIISLKASGSKLRGKIIKLILKAFFGEEEKISWRIEP